MLILHKIYIPGAHANFCARKKESVIKIERKTKNDKHFLQDYQRKVSAESPLLKEEKEDHFVARDIESIH